MLAPDAMAIGETGKIEKSWSIDTRIVKELLNGIFLVIDEFAALRIALDRKEFAEINDSLRRIILKGRAVQHSYYHGIAKARDICIRWSRLGIIIQLESGLGNLEDETTNGI